MNKKIKYIVRIPFCGFYDSEASYVLQETGQDPVECAEGYMFSFKEYLEAKAMIGVALVFEELVSPQFYDDDTDTINCKISEEDLLKLYEALDMDELRRTYEDSVFHDLDWSLPVTEWNLDQTELLFWCLLRQNGIDQINYDELLGVN